MSASEISTDYGVPDRLERRQAVSATNPVESSPRVEIAESFLAERRKEVLMTLLGSHARAWFSLHVRPERDTARPDSVGPQLESGLRVVPEMASTEEARRLERQLATVEEALRLQRFFHDQAG